MPTWLKMFMGTSTASNRYRNCTSFAPSIGCSFGRSYPAYAGYLAPLCKRPFGAVDFYHSSCLISRLCYRISPSTVIRRIVSIIINSVNRIPIWSWPHVINKLYKGIKPSIANLNTPRSIIPVMGVGRVEASLPDPSPSPVQWVAGKAVSFHTFLLQVKFFRHHKFCLLNFIMPPSMICVNSKEGKEGVPSRLT